MLPVLDRCLNIDRIVYLPTNKSHITKKRRRLFHPGVAYNTHGAEPLALGENQRARSDSYDRRARCKKVRDELTYGDSDVSSSCIVEVEGETLLELVETIQELIARLLIHQR